MKETTKKTTIKPKDFVVYSFEHGSSTSGLLCVIEKIDDSNPEKTYFVRSLENTEKFVFDKNRKEYAFDKHICMLTLDEAKQKGLYKPVYDLAIDKYKKNESTMELFQ